MSATDFDVCPQLNRLADGQRDTVVQMFHKMCSESQVVLRQVFMVNLTGMFEIFHNKMLEKTNEFEKKRSIQNELYRLPHHYHHYNI